jgi:hypothetical protein
MDTQEVARRRSIAAAADTDFVRWSDPRSLEPAWDGRAKLAASYVPAGAHVLDLGCGAMAVERFLPEGCTYQPCDLVARDPRTRVCDFNADEFPDDVGCDFVTVLGVLEYLSDVPGFLARLRGLSCPAVVSYSVAVRDDPAYRRALGWANDYGEAEILDLFVAAGLRPEVGVRIENGQILVRFVPDLAAA